MEENQLSEKQDMVDRKLSWTERMFDRLFSAIQKNPSSALLVLSVALNFLLIIKITNLQDLRVHDITTLNEKINIAVEKRVQSELPKQLAPYKEQQDSNSSKLDTSLINLNETVQSVKQYFNKKK